LKYREGLSEPAIETSNWIGKKANHGGIKIDQFLIAAILKYFQDRWK